MVFTSPSILATNTQIIEKQNDTALKLAVCIDRNSEALKDCAFELRQFQEGALRTATIRATPAIEFMKKLLLIIPLLALAGCSIPPLKGGKATTSQSAGRIEQAVVKSDNPAAVSKQDQETVRTKTYTVPAGSRLVETRITADAGGAPVTNAQTMIISAPMAVTEHETTRATTELGAAQKDTARELSAKLASLKGIVWIGVVVFLFGIATMFYPPLKAIIGSITTSAAITVGGLALIV